MLQVSCHIEVVVVAISLPRFIILYLFFILVDLVSGWVLGAGCLVDGVWNLC